MEYGYSVLMAIFSAALLLYARARVSVKPKNEKKYMAQLAKVIALVALSPALSALAGLWNPLAGLIVLILSAILFIWLGTKLMKNVE